MNTPLIEYTLEYLAYSGIQDVFIYCGRHPEPLEDYIKCASPYKMTLEICDKEAADCLHLSASKWASPSSPFNNVTLLRSDAESVGDVLRDLNQRDVIVGDFLLIFGDVVSNVPLEPVLASHRTRRKKDKNALMTLVLREVGFDHRTRDLSRSPTLAVNPKIDRCLHYEAVSRRKRKTKHLHLDPELLTAHSDIEIRQDLIDCHIDICSPDVLGLWSGEQYIDCQIRSDFLFRVLQDESVSKTIHTHITGSHYAARAKSLRLYDAVSKDVMSRWTYPFCPDSNLMADQCYKFGPAKIYKEDKLQVARTATVTKRSVIGRGTAIGESSSVESSVIGRNCKIGSKVTIQGSHLWKGVVVGDGTIIRNAIIADGAIIGRACRIEPGALIPFDVRLADDTTFGETIESHDYASDSGAESDASSIMSSQLVYRHPSATSSTSSISTLASSNPSDTAPQTRGFHDEAIAIVLDGMEQGKAASDIQLELTSYRMSEDASDDQVRQAVVVAFMGRIGGLIAGGATQESTPKLGMRQAVHQVFDRYQRMISETIFDAKTKTKVDQVNLLLLVQEEVSSSSVGDKLMLIVANKLYDLEIVGEEGLVQWSNDPRSGEGALKEVKELTARFVEKLQEAEEESDEEEEEEEEDDSDDDDDE